MLNNALRSSRWGFDTEALIQVMVFNQLCAPDNKLGCSRWLEKVAMPAIPKSITHQHLLRAMDALMERLDVVEEAISKQIRPLVDHALTLTVAFCDLTTVRIYVDHRENTLRMRASCLPFTRSIESLYLLHLRNCLLGAPADARGQSML